MDIKIKGKNRKHEEEVFDAIRKYVNNCYDNITITVEDDPNYKY